MYMFVYIYMYVCSIYENALKLFYFRIPLLLICSKFVVIFFIYLFIYCMSFKPGDSIAMQWLQ